MQLLRRAREALSLASDVVTLVALAVSGITAAFLVGAADFVFGWSTWILVALFASLVVLLFAAFRYAFFRGRDAPTGRPSAGEVIRAREKARTAMDARIVSDAVSGLIYGYNSREGVMVSVYEQKHRAAVASLVEKFARMGLRDPDLTAAVGQVPTRAVMVVVADRLRTLSDRALDEM